MQWFVTTKNIDEVVEAKDKWEAFDSVRHRDVADFGLIVEVQPVRETVEQSCAIRTSKLFGRWGERDTARRFIKAGIAVGLPDTSAEDLKP